MSNSNPTPDPVAELREALEQWRNAIRLGHSRHMESVTSLIGNLSEIYLPSLLDELDQLRAIMADPEKLAWELAKLRQKIAAEAAKGETPCR